MEEDNGGHRSDTDVSAQMTPGVSSSPGILVPTTVYAHQVSLPKFSSLNYLGENDSVYLPFEVQDEALVPVESAEKLSDPSEKPFEKPSENEGLSLADELKTYDNVVVESMKPDGDFEKVLTDKALDFAGTPQGNLSLVSGAMLNENGMDARDLGLAVSDPLDDDQPLCMVFEKGKLGEHGLVALVGRRHTEEPSCRQDVLPSPFSSPRIAEGKAYNLSKADVAEGVVTKTRQGERVVVQFGTSKSRSNNSLERSSRKGSMETRRAPRQVKKRRYSIYSLVYLAFFI